MPTANMVPFDLLPRRDRAGAGPENQCYVAYANYCGHEGEIQYCGQSSIAAPNGQLNRPGGAGDESLIVGTLDRQSILDARAANHYLQETVAQSCTARCTSPEPDGLLA
ncbi:nitrilase-related carbon-nitrogen hydrolase [Serratia proteamaculans]